MSRAEAADLAADRDHWRAKADQLANALVALSSAAFVHINTYRQAQRDDALVDATRHANATLDGVFRA